MTRRERPRPSGPVDIPAEVPPLPAPEGLADQARALGVEFDSGDLQRLGKYLAMLLDVSGRVNLTAIRDPDQAWTRHILDAVALVPILSGLEAIEAGGGRIVDIGSGGGVPGLPLAIVLPGSAVTLIEATGKKARFLRQAAAALGLTNVRVVQERAERAGRDPALRESFDAATARAVGHLAVVAELTLPLVRPGGLLLAVKGGKADEEVAEAAKAIRMLGGRHAATVPTPTGRVVVVEKMGSTPGAYPRRDGEPRRAPLGMSKLV